MIKRTEWKYEQLDENSWRVKVFSGWIVYTKIMGSKYPITMTGVYVNDIYHEWAIIPPDSQELPQNKPQIPECLL